MGRIQRRCAGHLNRRTSRLWLGAGIALVALGVSSSLPVWRPPMRSAPTVGHSRIQSIAVLPLENLSSDPEQEYFADGMTEELIGTLARFSALRVPSRTSVIGTRDQKSLPDIARELNVDAVLKVRSSGREIRCESRRS